MSAAVMLADWPEEPDVAELCLSLNSAGFKTNLRTLSERVSECKRQRSAGVEFLP